MPKIVYIAFLLIMGCRIVVMAGPIIHVSSVALAKCSDQEDNSEEKEAEKVKYEFKDESWFSPVELTAINLLNVEFIHLPNSRLFEHTRKPVSPPPDAA